MPRYSVWKYQGDPTGRTYYLSTTVGITGVGKLTFNADVSLEDIDRIVDGIREALCHQVDGFYPVTYVSVDDVLEVGEAPDYGFVTDSMARRLADEIADNDAFMEQYWLSLRTIVEEFDDFDDVRTAIANSHLWYEHELKLGTHVSANRSITGLMLQAINGTSNKKPDDIVIPDGTEGVIVGIHNWEEDGVEVEWYIDETAEPGADGDFWHVSPEWLTNDE